MTPERAVETLPVLLSRIDALRAEIERSAKHAAAQWHGLAAAGGQRADHAAALMSKSVLPSVSALRAFCERVEAQIGTLADDPFCVK